MNLLSWHSYRNQFCNIIFQKVVASWCWFGSSYHLVFHADCCIWELTTTDPIVPTDCTRKFACWILRWPDIIGCKCDATRRLPFTGILFLPKRAKKPMHAYMFWNKPVSERELDSCSPFRHHRAADGLRLYVLLKLDYVLAIHKSWLQLSCVC